MLNNMVRCRWPTTQTGLVPGKRSRVMFVARKQIAPLLGGPRVGRRCKERTEYRMTKTRPAENNIAGLGKGKKSCTPLHVHPNFCVPLNLIYEERHSSTGGEYRR